jgi:rfaE bifunctional protein kinase chain/domain
VDLEVESLVSEEFKRRRLLVIGDAVSDQFLAGTISRISREAPVFILRHEETTTVPGAAANAAANIASLGAQVSLMSVIGTDRNGDELVRELERSGVGLDGLLRSDEVVTPTKTRVLAGQDYSPRQQVIRIDHEPRKGSVQAAGHDLLARIEDAVAAVDAVVISDYGYGVVTDAIFKAARSAAAGRGIPLVVDSRYKLTELVGATTATPNREEVRMIAGADCGDDDCEKLRERLMLEALLVTNGNQGMTLFEKDHAPFRIPVVGPTEPVDVTGAGDTVIATYSLGVAAGMSFRDAAIVANHAGAIVVMKRGTATVSPAELLESLRERGSTAAANPV